MASILTVRNLKYFPQKFAKGKKVVLVGGCFDILHPGHVEFLEKARQAGDLLVVILESDQMVKKLKGAGRPVHTQGDRALILSSIRFVDFIVMLPFLKSEDDYDQIVSMIKPDIIATTAGISSLHHQRSAKLAGAKLKYVTQIVGNHSSSRILNVKRARQ